MINGSVQKSEYASLIFEAYNQTTAVEEYNNTSFGVVQYPIAISLYIPMLLLIYSFPYSFPRLFASNL